MCAISSGSWRWTLAGRRRILRSSGGQASQAKRHGLCKSLKYQNCILDSFSCLIVKGQIKSVNIYMIQITWIVFLSIVFLSSDTSLVFILYI